jgi:hypothetical protein
MHPRCRTARLKKDLRIGAVPIICVASYKRKILQYEVKSMKKTILALGSLGMITLLLAMAPDIRRYLRMRCM